MPRKQASTLAEVRADVRKQYRGTRSRRELVSFASLSEPEKFVKQEQACLLKAAGFSYSYIAEAVGFTRREVRAWFENPEMQARAAAFAQDYIDGAVKLIRTYAIELFEMLVEIARDGEIDAKVRIQAITECLDRMGLSKVNKSESAAVVTKRNELDITDRTGLIGAMEDAPPHVQQEMAAKMDEMMALASEHTGRNLSEDA